MPKVRDMNFIEEAPKRTGLDAWAPKVFQGPGEIVLVSVCDRERVPNLMPCEWHSQVGYNPEHYMVALSKWRHTEKMMQGALYFTVSFLPGDLAEQVVQLGSVSGKDVNKLDSCPLTVRAFHDWTALTIDEAELNIICETKASMSVGSHTLFVGEVLVQIEHEFDRMNRCYCLGKKDGSYKFLKPTWKESYEIRAGSRNKAGTD